MHKILSLSVEQLAAAIARREYTALQVLRAYRTRAEEIDAACNAIVCWFPDAEETARRLDEHLERTGETLGPLHGVPFSVKDHIEAKNTPMTLNLLSLRRHIEERRKAGKRIGARKDEPVVDVLKSLGAVPFAKTTMSQMGETWTGGGPAFGDTLNPWDTLRTSGGSSAGEGALVGAAASPFGIGSDVGGSLRIPSAFCGLCTLKPTVGRLARLFSHPGDYSIPATTGFMARDVKDLALLYRQLLSPALYDQLPRLARIPFDDAELASRRKLRVGYYLEEYTQPKPCPAAVRAMEEAIAALRARGHEVVLFRPSSEGVLSSAELRGADWSFAISRRPPAPKKEGGAAPRARRSPEEKLRASVLPPWTAGDEPIHPDLAMNAVGTQGMEVKGLEYVGDEGVPGWLRLLAKRDELRQRFHDYWRAQRLDALLCPAWALPPPRVEEARKMTKIVETTRVFNFLDMPAGVLPVGRVAAKDLQQPYEPAHVDPAVNAAALECLNGAEGLPVAVQVVAAPWREELVLRLMLELQDSCPFEKTHDQLRPVPRRSPVMGARPEPVSPGNPALSKL